MSINYGNAAKTLRDMVALLKAERARAGLMRYLCSFDTDFEQFRICSCSDGVFAPNEALNRYVCTACGGIMPDDFLEDNDDMLDPSGICEACGGTGDAGGIEDLPCPECNGEGRLW